MREMLRRWNERRKLDRGRCVNCRRPLRDDATSPYCSDRCAEDWITSTAY
jgi:endogenous inhibitor of DNA gyrase (YacG/DUF329 family)